MSKLITLTMLLLLVSGLSHAQDYSKPYEYSASSAPSSVTYFNFDITDSIYVDENAVHQLLYRNQPSTSWSSSAVDDHYQACTTFTYSGSISYQPPSEMLEWYFRSENDTVVISQSPKNVDDVFPVPDYLRADLGQDPTGDVENGGGSNVDITHCYGSYSDTRLYLSLDNNGGGFPTSGGFLTYYLYFVGLLNPSATDSVAYGMLYANNPIYSTGLYSMNLADSSLTNIGSISTNISANSLNMSCDIAGLVAQPGWPEWPPEEGFVGVAAMTMTVVLTSLSTNDVGKSALFMPSSHLLDFGVANTIPILSEPSVTHDDTGLVTAEITYTDSDNHLAVARSLFFDAVQYDMMACEKNYQNGAVSSVYLQVAEAGWYRYYFEFSDGVETVSTELDSVYVDLTTTCCIPPSVVDLDQSGESPSPANLSGIDLSIMIDGLFISVDWSGVCLAEADLDYSGAPEPIESDISGIDLSILIDALFISLTPPPQCDGTPN